MAASAPAPAEKAMSLEYILLEVCKGEEMKKSTPVTESVLQSAHEMLAILEGEH